MVSLSIQGSWHIFDPFRSGGSDQAIRNDGLGLGLSIVKHLVELHGGAVSAHSDGAACGATFRVVLPSAERRTAITAASACGNDDAIVAM